jgi:hypothetical protein
MAPGEIKRLQVPAAFGRMRRRDVASGAMERAGRIGA